MIKATKLRQNRKQENRKTTDILSDNSTNFGGQLLKISRTYKVNFNMTK